MIGCDLLIDSEHFPLTSFSVCFLMLRNRIVFLCICFIRIKMGIIILIICGKAPLENYFDFYEVIVCMFAPCKCEGSSRDCLVMNPVKNFYDWLLCKLHEFFYFSLIYSGFGYFLVVEHPSNIKLVFPVLQGFDFLNDNVDLLSPGNN